jgi:hypothetical protein
MVASGISEAGGGPGWSSVEGVGTWGIGKESDEAREPWLKEAP